MGIFNLTGGPDINRGVEEYRAASGAVLLDVRTREEYSQGHIPGSVNLPLQAMAGGEAVPGGKDAPLFLYCHSGARSARAARFLARMGYTNVKNIGGMAAYTGEVER